MAYKPLDIGNVLSPDRVARGTVAELKDSLISVARLAELSAKTGDKAVLSEIQYISEQALQLVDSYLLSAQSEYGQSLLPLEPTTMGSVFYEVSQANMLFAKKYNYKVQIDASYNKPVMVDRRAITVALNCLIKLFCLSHQDKDHRVLSLSAFKRSDNQVVAGVAVSGGVALSEADLLISRSLQGEVYSSHENLSGNGIQLALAESLALAMGGRILPIKRFKNRGIGIELIKSEQLSFV